MQRFYFKTITFLIFLLVLLAASARSQDREVEIAWTRHYAHETQASRDVPQAMLVDRSGNIYILAYVTNLIYGHSLLLVKFDQSGQELWRVEYTDGPGEETSPVAMRFDDAENIYVLSTATQQGSILGIVLIKFDSNGNRLRLTRYEDTFPSSSASLAVATDGSVYVTGNLNPPDSDSDVLILKYDPVGQLVWKDQYDGAAGQDDDAVGIALGPDESVYAIGRSETNDSKIAQVVTRRLGSNGDRLWEMHHDTRGSGDGPTDLAVDKNGQIVVLVRNEKFSEIIKYDSLGTRQWLQQTHPPLSRSSYANSLRLDNKRNVYVAGRDRSTSNENYFTIKYNDHGEEQWRAIFDDGGKDQAHSVTVDSSGNVYVAGTSSSEGAETDFMTVKYDSNGSQQWAQRYDAPDVEGFGSSLDQARAVVLAPDGVMVFGSTNTSSDGPTGPDIAVVKHNFPEGKQEWSLVLNGPGRTETGIGYFDIDGSDNIYLAGLRTNADLRASYLAVKYNPLGEIEWERQYRAGEDLSSRLRAMAVDREGNVYLGGLRKIDLLEPGRILDIVKLGTDGQHQWDFALHLQQDIRDNGTIYVLAVGPEGTICFSTNDPVQTLVSLNASGLLNWANSLSPKQPIRQILFDDENNVYVSGYHVDERYVFVNKYLANGNFAWSGQIENATISNLDAAFAAFKGGHLYLTNTSITGTFLTRKYASNGEQVWLAEYAVPAGFANAIALTVDQAENVLVTGWQAVSGGDREYLTLKYNSQGTELWARTYSGLAGRDNIPIGIGVDSVGNVTVTGQSSRGSSDDFETVQYSSTGDLRWSHLYESPANRGDQVLGLAIDSAGDVIVMGYTFNIRFSGFSVFTEPVVTTTIKYLTPIISSVANPDRPTITHWSLDHNYPNPFNPTTKITYSMPERGNVRLTIYNVAGQWIRTLFDGWTMAGQHAVEWDGKDDAGKPAASGIYFYKLDAREFANVKRMLLLR